MKRLFLFALVVLFIFSLSGLSMATNGDNLISIGPISRSMGGVGIAAPQDAISAVFSNPAAMCFGPYCPGSEFNFSGTIFMPKAHTRINNTAFGPLGDTGWKTSDSDLFVIPAIGISSPISPNLRFGLAAYGVSGMGVDYRDKFDLQPDSIPGTMSGNQDIFTQLQIMKFAPNIAYMINPNFSIGASLHVNYGALDLDDGTSSGFGVGAQIGAIYKKGPVSVGVVYVTPQSITHKDVFDFNHDNDSDSLKLESPQSFGVGVALEPIQKVLLIEADVKWLDWSNAKGYDDFDWRDQWVFALGAQYKPTPNLSLRAGVNYAKNPVKEHNGWDGAFDPPVNLQGKLVNRFEYEVFRITGFPAVVQTHLTAGIGYQISKSVSLDLGYTHAFKKSVKETGTFMGAPVTVEADLKEDSIDFGITWRF